MSKKYTLLGEMIDYLISSEEKEIKIRNIEIEEKSEQKYELDLREGFEKLGYRIQEIGSAIELIRNKFKFYDKTNSNIMVLAYHVKNIETKKVKEEIEKTKYKLLKVFEKHELNNRIILDILRYKERLNS